MMHGWYPGKWQAVLPHTGPDTAATLCSGLQPTVRAWPACRPCCQHALQTRCACGAITTSWRRQLRPAWQRAAQIAVPNTMRRRFRCSTSMRSSERPRGAEAGAAGRYQSTLLAAAETALGGCQPRPSLLLACQAERQRVHTWASARQTDRSCRRCWYHRRPCARSPAGWSKRSAN